MPTAYEYRVAGRIASVVLLVAAAIAVAVVLLSGSGAY